MKNNRKRKVGLSPKKTIFKEERVEELVETIMLNAIFEWLTTLKRIVADDA